MADAGSDASPTMTTGGSGHAGSFGFGALAIDPSSAGTSSAPPAQSPLPAGWSCDPALLGDAICDCGCGAADPSCGDPSCSSPGCTAAACQVCFGEDGSARDCLAPGPFSCGPARIGDGVCDCGCGSSDPDCAGGCFAFGCNVEGCERCAGGECGTPAPFGCNPHALGDGVCDCGCGNYDPDCNQRSSCTEPGCFALGCEQCHGERGKPVDCAPPASCEPSVLADGACDCGCGTADPDCAAGEGCALPGCSADGCDLCRDAAGRPTPCAGSFRCEAERYADGARCDCGCGRPDPDCKGLGCEEPGCDAAACDLRHDAAGQEIRPEGWLCAAERFGGQDGCDCGCGAIDPDCVIGCSEPGCRAPDCDSCRHEDGSAFECRWTCDLARYDDGTKCDCGCGAFDPDCGDLGCAEAGCFAPACDTCSGSGGELECERGSCDSAYFEDGLCDCGCRERDPDCKGALACLEPGCSDDGCERCHDEHGAVQACSDWLCSFEGQGTGDGCNCGCGAPDPDCGAGEGCAAPGCRDDACVSCRSSQGTPVSCSE